MHFLFATCNKMYDCSMKAWREDAGVTLGGPPSTGRAAQGGRDELTHEDKRKRYC